MSENPYAPRDPATPLTYVTPSPHGNARTQVLLAGVFNAIAAGLHGIAGLFQIGVGIFMSFLFKTMPVAGPPGAPPGAPGTPTWMPTFMLIYYIGIGCMGIVAAACNAVSAWKFLKKRRHAVVWGIVAGAISCISLFWCSLGCVLPLASGVYTIVVCCLPNTRAYLTACGNLDSSE